MGAKLDHLMVAHGNLDDAVAELAAATGITAAPGGPHPGQGTYNALASFGDGTYLELIAPDPNQDGGPLADRFATLDRLTLATWIARTDTKEAQVARAEAAGSVGRIVPLSRNTPDGDLLEWHMIVVSGHDAGDVMPIFIDWGTMPHPSDTQPTGLTLDRFTVSTPDADVVRAAFSAIELDAEVAEAAAAGYEAVISGPAGSITVTGVPTPVNL